MQEPGPDAGSPEKEVVIYNEDYSKCLSALAQNNKGSKSLSYATCRMDDADTWILTRAGKVINKQTGKCLSTLKGESKLIQSYCNFEYIRDYTAHELVIFENTIGQDVLKENTKEESVRQDDPNTTVIAKLNY